MLSLQFGCDRKPDRLQHRDRDLRQETAADLLAGEPREAGMLETVDLDRDDGRVAFVGDQAGAVIDLHQAAGNRQPALREDDQRIAAPDGVDERAHGYRLGGIERQRARN